MFLTFFHINIGSPRDLKTTWLAEETVGPSTPVETLCLIYRHCVMELWVPIALHLWIKQCRKYHSGDQTI